MMLPALVLLALAQDPGRLELLDRLRTEDPAARHEALAGLRRLGAEAVPDALKVLGREAPGLLERIDARAALVGRREWAERDEAMKSLVRLGRRALERIAELAAKSSGEARLRLEAAAAAIREREKSEQATELWRDAALCEFLSGTGDARAVAPLLKLLVDGVEGPADLVSEVRVQAGLGLGRLRPAMSAEQAEQASEGILGLLESRKDRSSAGRLVRALGGLKAPGAARTLARLVEDPGGKDVHLKRTALAALGQIGDPWGLKAVVRALRAPDAYLREGARLGLAAAGAPEAAWDPAEGPAPDAVFDAARSWWEKKSGKGWDAE